MSIKLFKVVNTEGVAMSGSNSLRTKDFLDDPSNNFEPHFINPSHILKIQQCWESIYHVNAIKTLGTKMQGKKYPVVEIQFEYSSSSYFYGTLEQLQICMANPNNYIKLGLPK